MKFIKIPNQEYEMGETPVTQEEWIEIINDNPSCCKGSKNPVDSVSWDDCQEFIKKLNAKNNEYIYRLPTEEEWEFCAKSCDEQKIEDIAWCYENSDGETHPVKQKIPNRLGLYDMMGNVWEWCEDLFYKGGSFRVFRGGSWSFNAQFLRSALRSVNSPGDRSGNLGFRLVRTSKTLPSNPITLNKTEHALSVARKALLEIEEILK